MSHSSIMSPGSVALVTGATSGIGRAVAEALLAAGLRVICAGRREDSLREICALHGDMAHA
ncbi:MAG: SDR family NAD(P)-dependent oxidoreductase, partial [Hyphomicrobiales bacterium]